MSNAEKPVSTTVRLPPDLHKRAASAAVECDRTMNNFIINAIRNELKRSDWLDRSTDDGK